MSKWEYGGYYKEIDMSGDINVGTGTLRVHDLFNPLPSFMLDADVLFCDPPCSQSNINSFYTKADIEEKQSSYSPFEERFFDCVKEIKPRILFLEVFASNKDAFIEKCNGLYSTVTLHESCYYHNHKYKCWIIVASNLENHDFYTAGCIDEQDVIEWICKNVEFKCIADLCMGQGLVAYYANKHGKKFVGTELNKKRLAVAVKRVSEGRLNVK